MSLIVQAHGGLGNQLFQAQYAHFIAERIPELNVHFRSTHSQDSRDFHLEGFFENCPHVIQKSPLYQLENSKNFILDGLLRRNFTFIESFIKRLGEGESLRIDELKKLSKIGSTASIRGYFQDRFFEANSCFDVALQESVSKKSDQDKSEYETVVHIRKGDFINFRSHGPLANEYFEKLLADFALGNSVLHTDAEKNQLSPKIWNQISKIKFGFENSPWNLLRDSVSARVFIGSNSTLSWWAATISEKSKLKNPSKILVPSHWKRENCNAQEKLIKPNWQIFQSVWES